MDHHGIVMGVIKDLDIIEQINQKLNVYDDEKMSVGERVAAMIMNGLGFTDQPLSLLPEFFEELPLEELFGKKCTAEDFDRFSLSRALDRIYNYGEENLFAEVAAHACKTAGVDTSCQSFDTTSFSCSGEYDNETDEGCVKVTHGYSKDHRPDLKQIVTELLVTHDNSVPLIMKNWDGNASDSKIFEQRTQKLLEDFKKGYTQHVIADSKFYTEDNSTHWDIVKFTTRVPETIKLAKDKIAETFSISDWIEHRDGKLKYIEFNVNHYSTDQRWLVCSSEESLQRASKSIENVVKKENEALNKALNQLQAKRFGCEEDANRSLQVIAKKWRYHRLDGIEIIKHFKYSTAGNPSNKEADRIEYQIKADAQHEDNRVEQAKHKKSCFIIASNRDRSELSNDGIIDSYKGQQSVERGYRFLKDPHFFTSSFFLKKPERISALIMIMTLSLLVYTIAQKKLRESMLEHKVTLPDQNKKLRDQITIKRAFQLLRGINIVNLAIEGMVHNTVQGLNEFKRKIIFLIGGACMKIYDVAPTEVGAT